MSGISLRGSGAMTDSFQSEPRAHDRKPSVEATGPANWLRCWANCSASAEAPRPVTLMVHSMTTLGSPCC
eukprot:10197315-Alexandrium_andersonii.AAC.1